MKMKSVAVFAVLLFLFGVSIASAAERDERLFSKQPRKAPHMMNVGKRQGQGGLEHFLKSLGSAGCESGCCWATANCDGADVSCSSSGCSASCADGSHASVTCDAT
jgi:hypothetical protein